MRYLPFIIRISLIALFLGNGISTALANDPVEEAQNWAKEAKDKRDEAKEAAAKIDCEKPKASDMRALAKAIKEARAAAENAQKWADKAQTKADEAAKTADRLPNNSRAQEAKTEAAQAAKDAQAAANEAKSAYEEALEQSEGMQAAAALEKELDKADTEGASKKGEIVERLKKTANEAAEKNHCDPEEVKRAVRVELEKIKKEVARNGEMKPWVDDLEKTLKDDALIYHQAPNTGNELVYTPRGTGRTTGHIADLTVFNPTGKPVRLALLPMLIPSEGKFQYYVTLGAGVLIVPAHGTITIKVQGNCANIFAMAVPAGAAMPPVENWITVNDPQATSAFPPDVVFPPTREVPALDSDWKPAAADGWVPAAAGDNGSVVLTYPGTDIPLGYTIDPVKHPEAAAPFLITLLDRIRKAYFLEKRNDRIETPISGNPENEDQTVVQHTFWMSSAALTGNAYKVTDFEQNTRKQFESATGRQYANLPAAEQEQIDQGVNQFWTTFEGVGIAAKVIHVQDI